MMSVAVEERTAMMTADQLLADISDLESGTTASEADSARFMRVTKVALAAVAAVAMMLACSALLPGSPATQRLKAPADVSTLQVLPPVVYSAQPAQQATGNFIYDGKWKTDTPNLATSAAAIAGAPVEKRNDGNKCQDDEEELAGLCYAKCSLLTQNTRPFRCSPFSCSATDCKVLHETYKLAPPCSGFDVAGVINNKAGDCPHGEGTCLQNEELFLDMCYKSCAVLTANHPNGAHPLRTAPATCCKAKSELGCLNPMFDETRAKYDVGGGAAGSPEEKPHPPVKLLTEAPQDPSESR